MFDPILACIAMGCGASANVDKAPVCVTPASATSVTPLQPGYEEDFEADDYDEVAVQVSSGPAYDDDFEADDDIEVDGQASSGPLASNQEESSITHGIRATFGTPSDATAQVIIGGESASSSVEEPAHDRASEADEGSEALSAARETQVPWEVVTLADLEMGDVLGSGGMGTVRAAHWRGELVAVKTLHGASAAQLAELEAELLVHATLRHPGVVRLLGASLVPSACCIILEHCLGSVFHRLHRSAEQVERRWLLTVALQVAEAMEYLHNQSPPIVHRDIKSHNVLLHATGAAKVCDFGLVAVRAATAGTPNYMAPELLLAKPYGRAVDVYAYAVLLNELHCREVPWDGYAPADIKTLVASGKRPRTEMTMALAAERLLHRAWHQEAAFRPTFSEIAAEMRRVVDALPLGAAALGLGALPPDSLDALFK